LPHLVEMHKKYAKDGMVAIPVSIDSLKLEDDSKQTAQGIQDKTIQAVRKKLQDKEVAFKGVILNLSKENDEQEFLNKKLRFNAPPAIFVFDRRGKWTQFNADDVKKPRTLDDMLHDIDKLVETLLKKQ
jgi:hypothetical protein